MEKYNSGRTRLAARVLLVLTVLVVTGALACDPGRSFVIVNETDGTIEIDDDGYRQHLLAPGESIDFTILEHNDSGRTTISDSEGSQLATFNFTWVELEEMDFRFVVR